MRPQFITSSDFKSLRTSNSLTRKQVADMLGVSVPTIQKWEESSESIKLSVPQFQTFIKSVSEPEEQQKIDDMFKEINEFWRNKVTDSDKNR